MADPTAIFWKRLQASELLPPSKFESLHSTLSANPETSDVKSLAKKLIADGVLTRYQAKSLLASSRTPLVFGEYVVIDELASAPFADTFQVKHLPTGHLLAAIVHRRESLPALRDPQRVAQLQQRLAAARSVRQAQVMRAYELVEQGEHVAVIADLVSGAPLTKRLREGALSSAEASSIALQIALALAAWHEQELTHGDLTPSNVILDQQGAVRLWRDPFYFPAPLYSADAASLAELESRAPYLAPELDVQQAPYCPLTDLYAFGALYYELLAGEPAFRRDSLVATMQAHATERIAPLEPKGVSKSIEQIVTYLMAKRPDVRYQRAADAADQIVRFAGIEEPVPAPPVAEPTAEAFQKWLDRRGTPRPSVAAAGGAVAGVAPSAAGAGAVLGAGASEAARFGAAVPIASDASSGSHNSPLRLLEARKKAQRRTRMIMAVVAVLVLIGGTVGTVMYLIKPPREAANNNGNDSGNNGEATSGEGNQNTSGDPALTPVVTDAAVPQRVVPDDGELLWESPTQGTPLSLVGFADNPRVLMTLRPAELLAGDEGVSLLTALGPNFRAALDDYNTMVGVNADQIEQMVLAFYDQPSASGYQSLHRIKLAKSTDIGQLKQQWESAGFDTSGTSPYRGAELSISVAESDVSGKVSAFLMGPSDLIDQAIVNAGAEAKLAPNLKLLLPSTDVARHLNLIATTESLVSDRGRAWLAGVWTPLLDAVAPILQSGIQALTLSVHRDGGWFVEWNASKQIGSTSEMLVDSWSGSIGSWGSNIEAGIAAVPQNPYWERVRLRYPSWTREALSNLRFGVEGPLAKANLWLPEPAGPNLIAGTELILSSLTETTVAVAPEVMTPTETTPATLDELLNAKFDFAVTSDDMINVMAQLQEQVTSRFPGLDFPFRIRLVGKDLGVEGITQNQRINNYNATDLTLSEILTEMVVKANPDKASASPRDDKQKLLWVVGPSPDNPGDMIILVTTRVAAVRDKLTLPEPFQPEGSE